MKYPETIYVKFDSFFAQAIEIAKDKVGLFNSLVSPPVRKQIKSNSFQKFLFSIIYIIKKAGWYIYVAIGSLIALGAFWNWSITSDKSVVSWSFSSRRRRVNLSDVEA